MACVAIQVSTQIAETLPSPPLPLLAYPVWRDATGGHVLEEGRDMHHLLVEEVCAQVGVEVLDVKGDVAAAAGHLPDVVCQLHTALVAAGRDKGEGSRVG